MRRPPRADGAAAILCADPLVVYACLDGSLSVARYHGENFPQPSSDLYFLSVVEHRDQIRSPQDQASRVRHRREFPRHDLIFFCNTEKEAVLLGRTGERAFYSNQNIMLSEDVYRPLPGTEVRFNAVYNARPEAWKRHELAFAIPTVAYVTYWYPVFSSPEDARARIGLLSGRAGHTVINPIEDGLPVMLGPEAVNQVYSRAAVGLCLSAAEGAMYAAVEYLLAGLPVVSTPSVGGRDVFFDPDYCLIVPPDPARIAEAVAELGARRVTREHIPKSRI